MENEINTVEQMLTESVQDDAALDQGESLSAILEENQAQEQPAADDTPPAKEPGWIKGRINKAVEKAVAETEARIRSEYEQMLAPIRESVLERQAQELVESGEFKTLAIAKEYLSLKGGMPQKAEQHENGNEQGRDKQGRFVSRAEQQTDPELNARADILAKQARKIKTNRGLDVMEAFNSDPDIKQKVLTGEWDFYDVADAVSGSEKRTPAAPVRSANGGGVSSASIMKMSAEQFRKLNENLSAGIRYDVRK